MEAARALAERLAAQEGSFADRLDAAMQRLLARSATAEERALLESLYHDQLGRYRNRPGDAAKLLGVGLSEVTGTHDPVELAALTAVTRALLNLHETITRY